MTTTGDAATDIEISRVRLDRPVLVSNLVSGALWLSPLGIFGSWILFLIGALYVVAAGAFLAAVYAREEVLPRRQEAWRRGRIRAACPALRELVGRWPATA